MISSIINAISTSLTTEFNYAVFTEDTKQDMTIPCFLIANNNHTTELYMGRRYAVKNQFRIQFYPSEAAKQEQCDGVNERINWCLEYITVDGELMRGSKMMYEMINDVPTYSVNYDAFVYKIEETELMEALAISTDAM